MPPQFLETILSSDGPEVGNTSVGMFGNAAAEETKTNEDKAATANVSMTENEEDVGIETPQFLEMRNQHTTLEASLPSVNLGDEKPPLQ